MARVRVYDESDNLIYKGSLRGAAKAMEVSRQHIYNVIKGYSRGLSIDSPAHYFVLDDVLYNKAEETSVTYDVGYQFNIKGTPITITDIVEQEDGKVQYTFNGYAVVNAEKRYTDYTTLYIAAQRALNK